MTSLFFHGIGYAILWFIGMFIVPLIGMLAYGGLTDFDDEKIAGIIYLIIFVLYWIISAIYLITL